jgi:hypothetical protein
MASLYQGINSANGDMVGSKAWGIAGKGFGTVNLFVDGYNAQNSKGGATVGDVAKVAFDAVLTFAPKLLQRVTVPLAVFDYGLVPLLALLLVEESQRGLIIVGQGKSIFKC